MMGYGEKLSKALLNCGQLKTPSFSKYDIPSTKTKISKTFGIARDKYHKAVIRGDTQADRANPGPGQYLADLIQRPRFQGQGETYKYSAGRPTYGSMFESS